VTPAEPRGPRRTDRAADVAAFFDGARLTIGRQLAGLHKSDLAALVAMTPTAVAAWESGAKRPAPATVARLALSLGVEPGFFAMRPDDIAAQSSQPHFRSLRSTTQLARDQASGYGQLAVDIARSLEKHVEYPEPDRPAFPVRPGGGPGTGGPELAARHVRRQWGIPSGPAPHLIRLLENHGVLVVFSPPQTASVDAYSFDSRLRPVVVLNPVKHDYYRQRFDVAHELGHLVMHAGAEPGGHAVEDQANQFAAEFLMPAAGIRSSLPTAMSAAAWQALARLKEHWGVSLQALLYRARRLGTLTEVSYRNAMSTLTARGWRRGEPGLVTVLEQPSMLPRALELLAAAGITEPVLLDQCRVPATIFRTVTSRTPQDTRCVAAGPAPDPSRVISLFG
jgi:Zn-dependent peptidase ImmA (M78 family)/transcriptional regulator with XRE-family HTH domain